MSTLVAFSEVQYLQRLGGSRHRVVAWVRRFSHRWRYAPASLPSRSLGEGWFINNVPDCWIAAGRHDSIETRSLPAFARSYPRRFTFYVADPQLHCISLAPARSTATSRLYRPCRSSRSLHSEAAPATFSLSVPLMRFRERAECSANVEAATPMRRSLAWHLNERRRSTTSPRQPATTAVQLIHRKRLTMDRNTGY
jgi:hypothetical protein